jgi:hypothetical protein
MDKEMTEQIDEWTDGLMDKWMDGRIGGHMK